MKVWVVMVETPTGGFDGSTRQSVHKVCASEEAADRAVNEAERSGQYGYFWNAGSQTVES